jgi:hypothetical protein
VGAGGVRVTAVPAVQAAGKARPKVRAQKALRDRVLEDFYKFHALEVRQEELARLRMRFQLDRQRVERMKQNRKFF